MFLPNLFLPSRIWINPFRNLHLHLLHWRFRGFNERAAVIQQVVARRPCWKKIYADKFCAVGRFKDCRGGNPEDSLWGEEIVQMCFYTIVGVAAGLPEEVYVNRGGKEGTS